MPKPPSRVCCLSSNKVSWKRRTQVSKSASSASKFGVTLAVEMSGLQKRIAGGDPTITPDKIAAFADLLRDKLRNGPPDLRQAYVRLVMSEVTVKDKEIPISGSKEILARAATNGLDKAAPGVLSFAREWRARKDSNL